jgi:hypothetical protein
MLFYFLIGGLLIQIELTFGESALGESLDGMARVRRYDRNYACSGDRTAPSMVTKHQGVLLFKEDVLVSRICRVEIKAQAGHEAFV